MIKRFNEWLLENEGQEPKDPETYEEVKALLDKWKIWDYTINDDLSVDVDGDVKLEYKLDRSGYNHFPIRFKKVTGYFSCHDNNMTSLKGLDKEFSCTELFCYNNKLENLSGLPEKFKTSLISCGGNPLTTLKGLPKEFTTEHFYCDKNNLTTLEDLPEGFTCREFHCRSSNLSTLEGFPYMSPNMFNFSFINNEVVNGKTLNMLAKTMLDEKFNWEQVLMKKFKDIPNNDWFKMTMPTNPSPLFQEWLKTKRGVIASKRLGL